MASHPSQRVIFVVDESDASLNRLLEFEKSSQWRADQLVLVAIVPRPLGPLFHEAQGFGKTISVEEFQSLKERLQECCELLVAKGYEASLQLIYRDDPRGVKVPVMALKPDLVVTPRCTTSWKLLGWFSPPGTSFLVDLLPCPVLVV